MLKLQYFGHLMRRTDSLEKTLMLGKLKAGGEGDDRGRNGWIASLTWWSWVWASSRSWWTGKPGMPQSLGSQRVKTRLSDWTERSHSTGLYIVREGGAWQRMFREDNLTIKIALFFSLKWKKSRVKLSYEVFGHMRSNMYIKVFFNLFLIEGSFLCNVVSVFAMQQHESAISF